MENYMAKVFNTISKAIFETDLKNATDLSRKYEFIKLKEVDEKEKAEQENEKNKKTPLENKLLGGGSGDIAPTDDEFENLKKEATELGIQFNYNISFKTLKERVEAKKEELKNNGDNE